MRTLSATSFLSFRIVSSRASLVLQTKSGALHIIYVMSDLENISQPVKPCEIDGGQESSALMVEYYGHMIQRQFQKFNSFLLLFYAIFKSDLIGLW